MPSVCRWPLVDWHAVVETYRPGLPATRARLNTLLKSHSLISAGFEFPVRHGRRMAGKGRVFSALNLEAALLVRRGDQAGARLFAEAAGAFEERCSRLLSEAGLVAADVAPHPEAPPTPEVRALVAQLAAAEAQLRAGLPEAPGEEELPGVITHGSAGWARIAVTDGSRRVVDVPFDMLRAVGLSVGDPVVVTREILGGHAWLQLLPAVVLDEEAESEVIDNSPVSEYLARMRSPASPSTASALATLVTEEPLVDALRLAG